MNSDKFMQSGIKDLIANKYEVVLLDAAASLLDETGIRYKIIKNEECIVVGVATENHETRYFSFSHEYQVTPIEAMLLAFHSFLDGYYLGGKKDEQR